jgi:DNA-binding transcriptional ArsR family regulator
MRLPDPADLNRAASIFRALAHPHRILLACCLANGRAATQSELLEQLGWPQSSLARHVGVLRERGLLRATRHGNQVLLELDGTVTPKLLAAVCHWVHPETGDRFATALPGTARVRA